MKDFAVRSTRPISQIWLKLKIPNERFIDVQHVPQTSLASFEVAGIFRSKPLAPLWNEFINDDDPTFGRQLFEHSETEAEPMVQPDGVTEDLRWKTKTAVAGRLVFHHINLSTPVNLTIS